ncbi:MAG: ATP-binding cassette domain-containing protein, partial [Proteobacteria bacterium]|nr:ATP-binding cassette domain-containing protein [Pseudomonadota bacterium]
MKKHFGGVRALEGIDLALEAGRVYCIVGPNGCGKSTLLGVISGELAPTAGSVWFGGNNITGMAPARIARMGVLRKFQAPSIFPSLTVAENVEAALMARTVPWGRLVARRHLKRLGELLDLVGLQHRAGLVAEELSHGEKQWLEISMLLAEESPLLLLDEPTAGMTIRETQQTVELIRRIASEHGRTILAIEHDMSFVEGLECEVIALLRGRVLC